MSLNEIAAELLSKLNADPEQTMRNLTAKSAGFENWADMKQQCPNLTPLVSSMTRDNYRLIFAPCLQQIQVEFFDVYDDASGTNLTVRLFIDSNYSVQI